MREPRTLEELRRDFEAENLRHEKKMRSIDRRYRIGTFIIILIAVFSVFGPEIIRSLHP